MPRAVRPWFRFYTETMGDRKILRLKPAERWVWAAVLAMACDSPERGVLLVAVDEPVTPAELARHADVPVPVVRSALDAMLRLTMLTEQDGRLVVTNWGSRQYESDSSTDRSRKHRSNVATPLHATLPNPPLQRRSNGPETETETENELLGSVVRSTHAVRELRPDRSAAAKLVSEYRLWLKAQRKPEPPRSLVASLTDHTAAMLAEGISPDLLAEALRAWDAKGMGAGLLPSVVHELQRPRQARNGASRGGFDPGAAMARAQQREDQARETH